MTVRADASAGPATAAQRPADYQAQVRGIRSLIGAADDNRQRPTLGTRAGVVTRQFALACAAFAVLVAVAGVGWYAGRRSVAEPAPPVIVGPRVMTPAAEPPPQQRQAGTPAMPVAALARPPIQPTKPATLRSHPATTPEEPQRHSASDARTARSRTPKHMPVAPVPGRRTADSRWIADPLYGAALQRALVADRAKTRALNLQQLRASQPGQPLRIQESRTPAPKP